MEDSEGIQSEVLVRPRLFVVLTDVFATATLPVKPFEWGTNRHPLLIGLVLLCSCA